MGGVGLDLAANAHNAQINGAIEGFAITGICKFEQSFSMGVLKSITAAAACAATVVDAAALLPRANSTKKLVTSVCTQLLCSEDV